MMAVHKKKQLFHPVFLIPSGSHLTFPEYHPNAESKDSKLVLDATRHKALEEVSAILQKEGAFRFENYYLDDLRADPQRYLVEHTPPSLMSVDNYADHIRSMSDDEALAIIREFSPTMTPDLPLTTAPNEESSIRYAEDVCNLFTSDMKVIDLLHTETLLYLASSYSGTPSDNWHDSLQSILPAMKNMMRMISNGEDVNTLIQNLAAYRKSAIPMWQRKAFEDVRFGDPVLDRHDLYNLKGEEQKWAARIIEASMHSRSIWHEKVRSGATGITGREEVREELKRTRSRPHIASGLASLLREGDEWTGRVRSFMEQRRLTGTEVSFEMVRSFYLEGSLSLNTGML